jgi:hypothetical protein
VELPRAWQSGLAAIVAAIPVVFGLVRAIQTGTDVRYLVTALVSLIAAAASYHLGSDRSHAVVLPPAATFAVATAASAAAAFAQGARSWGAVWMVTAGFSLCTTAGAVLLGRSRATHRRETADDQSGEAS